jgi:hypothetical protein
MTDWFIACETFEMLNPSIRKAAFLCSDLSGPKFTGIEKLERVSFGKMLIKYRKGTLKHSTKFKSRPSLFPDVEEKLVAYIDLRAKFYKRDKCGLSWDLLKIKARKFADDLGYKEFRASNGWLRNTLKRHDKIGISLHGEADDVTLEDRLQVVDKWKMEEFHPLIDKYKVPPERIYNADQTGLFYQKLPTDFMLINRRSKSLLGQKQMKDKTRITLMVCTTADGNKVPLSVVGKPKNTVCFRLWENGTPPLAYTNQKNSWYDKGVTLWWLKTVFIPHHMKKCGIDPCILILDNCPAHKVNKSLLPRWCHIIFLPPNMTSNFQPADMGMIASFKI